MAIITPQIALRIMKGILEESLAKRQGHISTLGERGHFSLGLTQHLICLLSSVRLRWGWQ